MTSFINALPGAITQGMIWGVMAIGLYITYKLLEVSDLTVDGSFCTGGAVCVMMMLSGYNVWIAMLGAMLIMVSLKRTDHTYRPIPLMYRTISLLRAARPFDLQ